MIGLLKYKYKGNSENKSRQLLIVNILFNYNQALGFHVSNGLNISGTQKSPLIMKLRPRFLVLPKKLGFLLPNIEYVRPVETAIQTVLIGISPIGNTYSLLN